MHLVGTGAPAFMDATGAAIRGADWGGMRYVRVELGAGTDLGPALKLLDDPDFACCVGHVVAVGTVP